MRNLAKAINDLDLIDVVYGGAQTAMDAEYRIINDDTEGEKVEHVRKGLPDCRRSILAGAFEVESVGLRLSA